MQTPATIQYLRGPRAFVMPHNPETAPHALEDGIWIQAGSFKRGEQVLVGFVFTGTGGYWGMQRVADNAVQMAA